MNIIDQNNALKSRDRALVPAQTLIDGRTETDLLDFLVNFSTLINFYDSNNIISSNWQPFLLKDPVFLTASISKTRQYEMYSLFKKSCQKINTILKNESKINYQDLSSSFNHLFDQLTNLFVLLENWTSNMQRSKNEYNLKSYLFREITYEYAQYFWAILALRQNLSLTLEDLIITAPYSIQYEDYDQKIWQESKDKRPFWEVLDLKREMIDLYGYLREIFESLYNLGNRMFDFLRVLIQAATQEFNDLRVQKSDYPDTILLRAFVKLFSIHQKQLNQISKKHLNFYYQDILRQKELSASPDEVFICAELADDTATFRLPKGTLFDAGQDIKEEPIVFESINEVNLNPANVLSAYTLSKRKNDDDSYSLYKETIDNPSDIRKDEFGQIESWSTFGGKHAQNAVKTSLGFAYASPMLYLKEGIRTINITITFNGEINDCLFENMTYYLSTKDGWMPAPITNDFPLFESESIELEIIVDKTAAAIESFEENPDGIESMWPMFKMVFVDFPVGSSPPQIKSIKTKVDVKEVKNFLLFNDDGALSTTAPFQVLGSIPMPGNSFVIGSSEIFSKPLDSLDINFTWENLPPYPRQISDESVELSLDNFQAYYQEYNSYLKGCYTNNPKIDLSQGIASKEGKNKTKSTGGFLKNIFASNKDEDLLSSNVPIDPPDPCDPSISDTFQNLCFKVNFDVLQDQDWSCKKFTSIPPSSELQNISEEGSLSARLNKAEEKCNDQTHSLFVNKKEKPDVSNISAFKYSIGSDNIIEPDPFLQLSELEFTGESLYGFMKMKLKGPVEGFGSEMYGQVVSAVALKNAQIIAGLVNGLSCDEVLLNPPNPPFVPNVELFTANYTATEEYVFEKEKGTFPIQCFYYTPFINYEVYSNTNGKATQTSIGGQSGQSKNQSEEVKYLLPLYPSFDFDGALFLEMENLISPAEMNIDFQLIPNFENTTSRMVSFDSVQYDFLTSTGWEKLPLLSDGTKNFTCPGIINFNIPNKASDEHIEMPGINYWISIGANDANLYARTVFLKTNGIELQRVSSSYLDDLQVLQLRSDSVIGPVDNIPEIETVVQPFPSFGGRAAEDKEMMDRRVSTRLKSKDRVVSSSDYYRVTKEAFRNIYYVKTFLNEASETMVLVVERVHEWTAANAFRPLETGCGLQEIQNYLRERASAFANIRVANFLLAKVNITADIYIQPGYETDGVVSGLKCALNIFLSPWISSPSYQIEIDNGINLSQVEGFINNFQGVSKVENIIICIHTNDEVVEITKAENTISIAKEFGEEYLLVPGLDHIINSNPTQ